MGVADGFQANLKASAVRYLAPIYVSKKSISQEEEARIREICGPNCVMEAFSLAKAVISAGVKTTFLLIEAVSFDGLFSQGLPEQPTIGKWPRENGEIVLGAQVAKKLNVQVGQTVRIFVDGSNSQAPQYFQVSGIHQFGYFELDERMAYLSVESRLSGARDGLKIYPPEKDFEEISSKFVQEFDFPWLVRTWKDLNPTVIEAIAYEKTVLFVITSLIVIMAVLNLAATVFTIVFERNSDFSILRALGLTQLEMVRALIIEAFRVCWKGMIGGLALGALMILFLMYVPIIELPPEIYMSNQIPVSFNRSTFLAVAVFSGSVCFLGALIPSLILANASIVDGFVRE
jgi:lipoprotein-releasing system permease protein